MQQTMNLSSSSNGSRRTALKVTLIPVTTSLLPSGLSSSTLPRVAVHEVGGCPGQAGGGQSFVLGVEVDVIVHRYSHEHVLHEIVGNVAIAACLLPPEDWPVGAGGVPVGRQFSYF